MASVGFCMVTWLSSFYLLLLKICCWRITGLSLKPIITIQPILHLGLNVTTDRTLLPLGSKCYYGWDINYAWVRLLHFCQYGGVQKLPKITTAQILVNPKSHSVIRFWALDASFSLPLNFFFFSLESDKVYFIHRRLHPLMYFKYMSCFVGRPEWKLHCF